MPSTPAREATRDNVDVVPTLALARMIHGCVVTQVVSAVARLGLVDHFGDATRSGSELAGATGAHPDALLRPLRAAATVGLFTELEQDSFALTPVGACLATTSPSGSLARHAAVTAAGRGQWRCLERLTDAVMTGRSVATDALGMGVADYYQEHPEEGAHFTAVMADVSAHVAAQVLAHYDPSGFTRIIDIGGGHGGLLTGLLEAAPQATGVLFDRPEVIAGARTVITDRSPAQRVELVAGDLFIAVPTGGDLYVLNAVLHHWDDEHATHILDRCHHAAAPGSTLLLIERLLPTQPTPSPLHLADLANLVIFGGRERTRDQYAALLDATGYQLSRVIPIPAADPWNLLETHRR